MKNRMRQGPALILTLAIIASVQTAKDLKSGPCFKFKVTNGDNVTKIFLEHDQRSTIEAAADSCNGRRMLNISISTPASPIKRHPDYELFPGVGFYRLHPVALNWESAQEVCRDEGGDLVVIDSEAEKNLAVTLFERKITFSGATWADWVWIGLKRQNGQIKTVFGDPMSKAGYAVWNKNQPNNDGDCILFSNYGTLADQKCSHPGAYICELPL